MTRIYQTRHRGFAPDPERLHRLPLEVVYEVDAPPIRRNFWRRLADLPLMMKIELACAFILVAFNVGLLWLAFDRYGLFTFQFAGVFAMVALYFWLVWYQDIRPGRRRGR